ncbi:MAG: TPM domain-containing protein [Acidobacteriota bacterium]|jgi:putative membrane protein
MRLSVEDKKAIADAIKRAEQLTSGEIVFAFSDASGHYLHATLQAALAGTVLATALYLALPILHTITLVLWLEIVAFAVFYAVVPRLPMRRWFIPAREMEECVHDAAFREFYAGALYRTRESNGVLIYLSDLERRVVVLGDKGIHEKMGDTHWTGVRDEILRGIKQGKAREGICAAVETCGRALAEHFPHRPDDVNELPDEVIDHTRKPRL